MLEALIEFPFSSFFVAIKLIKLAIFNANSLMGLVDYVGEYKACKDVLCLMIAEVKGFLFLM